MLIILILLSRSRSLLILLWLLDADVIGIPAELLLHLLLVLLFVR